MLDFYEVWEKEIIKKRIAIGFAVVMFLVAVAVVFSAFVFTGEEKTIKDYAFVYVVERFNYTPYDVDKAYFSRYQYKPVGYRFIVEDEINKIKELSIVSFFKPLRIRVDRENRKVEVWGSRTTGRLKGSVMEGVTIRKVKIILTYNAKGFMVEKIE